MTTSTTAIAAGNPPFNVTSSLRQTAENSSVVLAFPSFYGDFHLSISMEDVPALVDKLSKHAKKKRIAGAHIYTDEDHEVSLSRSGEVLRIEYHRYTMGDLWQSHTQSIGLQLSQLPGLVTAIEQEVAAIEQNFAAKASTVPAEPDFIDGANPMFDQEFISEDEDERTIGELAESGELPPDLCLPISVQAMNELIHSAVTDGWNGAEAHMKSEGRHFICDMLLPDGKRFGDTYPVDLLPYADMTFDELIEVLVTAEPEADGGCEVAA